MKRNRLAGYVVGAAALGLVGVVATTGTASAQNGPAPVAAKKQGLELAAAPKVAACNGGAALGMVSRSTPVPFSFPGTSNTFVAVPGAKVTVNGPKSGYDTLLVTFSAETYYTGTGWMGLEVLRDGVPIQPFANNGSPFAFASKPQYQGNSVQFCTKIRKGTHTISVVASTTGGATESGWLDDWTLSLVRFN